ncbi:hypothetical protein I2W78_08175 [Streptomyces spinoverrucosus]|uniref:hypothetical protein n=1 Tax=Streptomyces spinoverrucosus TaxID=284043 RepID=UPI0018C395BE|nr:hypothetical protein [Streptomyces spinoverrucosus]MBG0851821.1 hypothetical protein [Streptomyces spinoverrucosus]
MRDGRQEIADALADSGRTERELALDVLGCAVRWAADTLGRHDRASDGGTSAEADGAEALAALYALYDALADARGLGEALPGLLEAARPGERMGGATRDLMAELTAVAERVASERAALQELADREEELRRRLAEHEKLRQEADELRRLEQLVEELDDLRAQHEVIDTRLRELRDQDPEAVDRELRTGADALLRITEQQLAVLAPRTRQALERAAAAQRALAAAEQELSEGSRELAGCQERLERIQTEQGPVFASLARHGRADRELAQALREAAGDDSGSRVPEQGLTLEEVQILCQTVEERLADADRTLSRVLAQRLDDEQDGRTRITRPQP